MTEASRGALSGRVGLITGAGSGLGRSVALALARQGANVVVADFDAPRMERTVEEILRLGTTEAALSLATDVRDDASVRGLVRSALKAMGRVDILINAAGVLLQGRLDKISTHDWTWMLDTNLLGAVRTSLALRPHMSERGSGHIINVVSHGGLHPGNPHTIAYDTGHAALAAFTEGLAQEVGGTGVNVSLFCLAPNSPRIGQNTRSRGIGRWIGDAAAPQDGTHTADQLARVLIEGIHQPSFVIAADPSEREALRRRWSHMEPSAGQPQQVAPLP
jgi:NAD(P)-dependent dehydrogenase (short-subunit alcohol dehydrogenase family)